MVEKKKDNKKTKTATKVIKPKAVSKPKGNVETELKDPTYPAAQIAQSLNVSDFVFLLMKQEANINDGSFLTIAEFQEIQNKVIKGR